MGEEYTQAVWEENFKLGRNRYVFRASRDKVGPTEPHDWAGQQMPGLVRQAIAELKRDFGLRDPLRKEPIMDRAPYTPPPAFPEYGITVERGHRMLDIWHTIRWRFPRFLAEIIALAHFKPTLIMISFRRETRGEHALRQLYFRVSAPESVVGPNGLLFSPMSATSASAAAGIILRYRTPIKHFVDQQIMHAPYYLDFHDCFDFLYHVGKFEREQRGPPADFLCSDFFPDEIGRALGETFARLGGEPCYPEWLPVFLNDALWAIRAERKRVEAESAAKAGKAGSAGGGAGRRLSDAVLQQYARRN